MADQRLSISTVTGPRTLSLSTRKPITRFMSGSRPTRKSWAQSSDSPSKCLARVAFGQVDGQGGSEILVLEGQSGRAKVLTLDQSSDDEANRRGRVTFFALPQGSERGRSLAVGDLDGDHKQDVIVTDPANAQVWVYLQTGRSGLSSGSTFPSLGNARTVRLAQQDSGGKHDVYVLSEQEKQIGHSIFEKGRLSFPAPLSLTGEPVSMDVVDLDGDKAPEIIYVARAKAKSEKDADTFELRSVTREKSGAYSSHQVGRGRLGRTSGREGSSCCHQDARHQSRWAVRPLDLQRITTRRFWFWAKREDLPGHSPAAWAHSPAWPPRE